MDASPCILLGHVVWSIVMWPSAGKTGKSIYAWSAGSLWLCHVAHLLGHMTQAVLFFLFFLLVWAFLAPVMNDVCVMSHTYTVRPGWHDVATTGGGSLTSWAHRKWMKFVEWSWAAWCCNPRWRILGNLGLEKVVWMKLGGVMLQLQGAGPWHPGLTGSELN